MNRLFWLVGLLRQVTEALIGRDKLSHEARHLQAGRHGDAAAPHLQHKHQAFSFYFEEDGQEVMRTNRRLIKHSILLWKGWRQETAPRT